MISIRSTNINVLRLYPSTLPLLSLVNDINAVVELKDKLLRQNTPVFCILLRGVGCDGSRRRLSRRAAWFNKQSRYDSDEIYLQVS